MDRKEITNYLEKFFNYRPTTREIIWYEMHHEPRKEIHMTDYDRLNINRKNFLVQFEKLENWVSGAKKVIAKHFQKVDSDEDVDRIISKIHKALDDVYRSEQAEWRRKQLRYMKAWHEHRGSVAPDEIKKLLDEIIYAKK